MAALSGCATPAEPETSAQQFTVERTRDGGTTVDASTSGDAAVALRDFLADFASRAGEGYPRAWRHAQAADFQRVGELSRAGATGVAAVHWDADLDAVATGRNPPTRAQRDAVGALARASFANLRVGWYDALGTPSELRDIGFVARGVAEDGAWRAFYGAYRAEFDALFGIGADDELRQVAVDRRGAQTRLSFLRFRHGAEVPNEWFEVFVSSAESDLGAGVITGLRASWSRALGRMPATPASAWLTEASARSIAGGGGDTISATLRLLDGSECTPVWDVVVSWSRVVRVNALDGRVMSEWDPRHNIGPLRLNGYPPGATTLQSIRLRGANVTVGGSSIGWTNLNDATHSLTNSTSVDVNLQGGVPTSGTWPLARVEVRSSSNGLLTFPVAWTPSTQPNRDFGSPNAWSANSSAQRQSASIAYGWVSYWQSLFNTRGIQVPDTISLYRMSTSAFGSLSATRGGAQNGSVAGSGQSTWGSIEYNARLDDDVSMLPSDGLFTFAHEHGHNLISCASTAGGSCANADPEHLPQMDPQRTPVSSWRAEVHNAAEENLANLYGLLLTQFRYDWGELAGRPGAWYQPNWTYESYDSQTDGFGTPTQDSAGAINCLNPGTPCPSGYACVTDTFSSPLAPQGMAGLCARICTTAANCTASLPCDGGLTTNPSMVSVCWPNYYWHAFFVNVGARLAMTDTWHRTLDTLYAATAGNSNNARRDFVTGSDNWYARLADSGSAYEVTRAVRSVYSGTGFVARDDFTSNMRHAAAIPIVTHASVPIYWGNGAALYPSFVGDTWGGSDWVLFRGVAGARYAITAASRSGTAVVPNIAVYRWGQSPVLLTSAN